MGACVSLPSAAQPEEAFKTAERIVIIGNSSPDRLIQVGQGAALGGPQVNLFVINSLDAYVAGVADLLHIRWLLSGYQPDYCAPGGSLVFELRQVPSSGEFIVRVYYTSQTFDQLRNMTPLTTAQPPATMQLFIPNATQSLTSLDVDF
jgi:4-phytase / acid phosphatase